jgi:hypothetical protein
MIRLYSPYCMPTAGAILPQSKEVSRMAFYKRGDNWYIDFTFKGQRIRESIKANISTLNPFERG